MTISPNKWELDVQGYLNVCNITSALPRQQIRDFAKGVNDLGLWNSMVCWPLRSSQNYGSGTTAFSLGGLGTYNGTLVDGPTWNPDNSGINFGATAARILATGTFAQPLTVLGSVDYKTSTDGGALIDGSSRVHIWSGGNVNRIQFFAGTTLDSGVSNTFATGKNFVAGYANGASSVVYTNGTGTSGNAGTNSLGGNTIFIGNNNSPNFGASNIDIAFCAIFSGQAYNDAIRTLYKSTLGTGLSLP
jgi:hypothetical protein